MAFATFKQWRQSSYCNPSNKEVLSYVIPLFFCYNGVLKFYKRYLCYCDRLHGEFFWKRELDLQAKSLWNFWATRILGKIKYTVFTFHMKNKSAKNQSNRPNAPVLGAKTLDSNPQDAGR